MQRDPILLREKRFNFLPHRFLHRGIERRVRSVERVWSVDRGRRRAAGHYFRVHCQDDAVLHLFHDVALNAWFAERPGWISNWWPNPGRKDRLRWIST
jgi:hypothetical protein